jgi:peptidoglycan/LPS O-acetylase OafA/YrhL
MQVGSDVNLRSFRPDVQGLRAIAVLLVLVFHFETPVQGGYLGVDMFFVISGFVIASSTLREIDRTHVFSWRSFLRRRVRRLLPGVAVVSILVAAISVLLLSPFGPQQTTSQMVVGAATYTSNFMLMSRNYFALDPKSNPLMHFWSLAVEEQFYLLWPIVIGVLLYLRRRLGKVISTGVVWLMVLATIYATCRLFVWFSVEGPTINDYSWFRPLIERDISPQRFAFYSPLTRAWEFVAGVAVALVLRSSWISKLSRLSVGAWLIGAALVVVGVRWATVMPGFEQGTDTATNSSATILAVVGTAVMLLTSEFATVAQKTLSIKPLTTLGDWSYSVYLWHWPIWVLLITTFNRSWQVTIVALALSLLLGWAQFRWIEKPIRDGLRIPRVNFGRLVVGFVAIAALVYGAKSVITPAIGKHLAGHKSEEISAHIIEKPCSAEKFVIDTAQSCTYATTDDMGTVVLVGDSMARSLSDGFVSAANAEGLNAYVFSLPGCSFLAFDSPFSPTLECIGWRQNVFTALSQLQPKLVMIANMNTLYTQIPLANFTLEKTRDAWGYELTRTFDALAPLQTKVMLVQPPPSFEYDLRYDISLLRKNGVQENREAVIARRAPINQIEVQTAALYPFLGPVLNFDDLFCNVETCTQKIGKQFMLEDADHLSVDGSMLVAPLIQNAIALALAK